MDQVVQSIYSKCMYWGRTIVFIRGFCKPGLLNPQEIKSIFVCYIWQVESITYIIECSFVRRIVPLNCKTVFIKAISVNVLNILY